MTYQIKDFKGKPFNPLTNVMVIPMNKKTWKSEQVAGRKEIHQEIKEMISLLKAGKNLRNRKHLAIVRKKEYQEAYEKAFRRGT